MNKIDHLGIAVPDLEVASEEYRRLGFEFLGSETVASQKVDVGFFKVGDARIELLAPTADDSPIAGFLAKRAPGMHHLCVEVEDLDATLAAYKREGVRLIDSEPVIGAGGHRVAFIHPKSTSGVLLELKEVATKAPQSP